jgi:DNA-directed RNA polymerase specialized sigma24 family protein
MSTILRQQEFQTLVDQHKKILYKVCNSYCRNREDREDLAQEIVVQLWRSFQSFDERVRFSTWMYRIALNVAISAYRRESARTQSDEIQALHRAIAALNPLDKALVLLYLDGNSYQDMAAVLGISETNVATKISRMKQKMRQEFSGSAQA